MAALVFTGCDVKPASSAPIRPQQALSDADFTALIERISAEPVNDNGTLYGIN